MSTVTAREVIVAEALTTLSVSELRQGLDPARSTVGMRRRIGAELNRRGIDANATPTIDPAIEAEVERRVAAMNAGANVVADVEGRIAARAAVIRQGNPSLDPQTARARATGAILGGNRALADAYAVAKQREQKAPAPETVGVQPGRPGAQYAGERRAAAQTYADLEKSYKADPAYNARISKMLGTHGRSPRRR